MCETKRLHSVNPTPPCHHHHKQHLSVPDTLVGMETHRGLWWGGLGGAVRLAHTGIVELEPAARHIDTSGIVPCVERRTVVPATKASWGSVTYT